MQFLATIGITILTAVVSAFGLYNYLPLKYLETSSPKLGATITTIAGSDTISSSRTTINTNFSNLNAYKIENSTTSVAAITTLSNLTSIGTIGTGVWQGTGIGVGYGGTGSTTLATNRVMLGNGTSGFTTITPGTSGQFLTSNGAGSAPSFQSSTVNQTDNYAWTGNHNFTGTTRISTLHASSTVVLNGVSNSFPATQGATSTYLGNNGSGSLTWNPFDWREWIATTTASASPSGGFTLNMPANASSTNLRILVDAKGFTGGAETPFLRFNGDTNNFIYTVSENLAAVTTAGYGQAGVGLTQNATTSPMYLIIDVHNEFGQPKFVTWRGTITPSDFLHPSIMVQGSGYWNNSTSTITSIGFSGGNSRVWNVGTSVRVMGNKE